MSNDLDPDIKTALDELRAAAFAGPPVEPSAPVREFATEPQVIAVATSSDHAQVHDMGEVRPRAGNDSVARRRSPMAALAAASFVLVTAVGVGHAAGIVDVPMLPDVGDAVVSGVADDTAGTAISQQSTSTTSTTVAEEESPEVEPTVETAGAGVVVVTGDDGGVRFEVDFFGSALDDEALESTVKACHEAFDAIDSELEGEARREAAADAAKTCRDTFSDAIRETWPDAPFLDSELFNGDEFPKLYEDLFDGDLFKDGRFGGGAFEFAPLDPEELDRLLDDLDLDSLLDEHGLPPELFDPERFRDFNLDDFNPEDFGLEGFDPQKWFDGEGNFFFGPDDLDPEARAELEAGLLATPKRDS